MIKKIGDFLFIMLAICAVLILMATGGQKEDPDDPVTPTATQQTTPAQTKPQQQTKPILSGLEQSAGQVAPSYAQVQAVLDAKVPEQTARTNWTWVPELNYHGNTRGSATESLGWALAQIAADRKMNPIAAFWILVNEGLYEKNTAQSFSPDSFQIPDRKAGSYAYDQEGIRQFLTDVLTLAGEMKDGLALEEALLGEDGAVESEQVKLEQTEDCWYGYFAAGGERSTHILCFYLWGDGDRITVAEFQLLNLRSAQGIGSAPEILDRRGENQAAALMAAMELLLTGRSQVHAGGVIGDHQVENYRAKVERFAFTAEGEVGTLINFSIRCE